MMKPDGAYEDFAYDQYVDYIGECVEPWSYQKFPYAKKWGKLSLDLDNPRGVPHQSPGPHQCRRQDGYPAGPEGVRGVQDASAGRPIYTLLYHYARLIELLQCAEQSVELLDDPEITSTDIRVPITPRAARGVGCVEAPRGTLIHDYECDANGLITKLNLIVGTTHNNAAINMSVNQAAKLCIKDGKYDQGILNKVEMAIRAYDP